MNDEAGTTGGATSSARRAALDDPETLRALARILPAGLYVADAEGRLLDANPALLEMIGVPSLDGGGPTRLAEIVSDASRRQAGIATLTPGGPAREFEFTLTLPDGSTRSLVERVIVRQSPQGEPVYCGTISDITARRALEQRLLDAGTRDPLTGSYNHLYLDTVSAEMARDSRGGWGCLFANLDGFADHIAQHGPAAGDDALLRMSRFLMRHVRADEPVVRLGDHAFVVVLKGANEQRTERIARRLQLAAMPNAPVSFSLGWAVRRTGETFDALLARAAQSPVMVRLIERPRDARRRGSESEDYES
jgi:diguanylate cyclase (GGDEF)-like protein/PAS domain S-box-containing protein